MTEAATKMKVFMSGDEALARGAYEAGVHFASSYPGTPSTEILENITQYSEIYSEWAPNEKVAFEAAAGASIGGMRAISPMKHVGVNLATDALFTFSYTGVNGGMVLITCDEPGMHSSQNEQDNRYYAIHSKVPLLEPANSQECIDMMKTALDLSESFDTPVLMRVTTRICHSKGLVELNERVEVPIKEYVKNVPKYVPVPALAVGMRARVEERMNALQAYSNTTSLNYIEKGGNIGVIASGMSINFAKEVFGKDATYLKLGFTYPLPDDKLDEFYALGLEKVYIIEENDPFIQHWVERRGYECIGKPIIPPFGEMTPDVLRHAIFGEAMPVVNIPQEDVVNRPPAMCSGCPHRGFFYELGKRKDTIIAGDIGCYTLGVADPFNAIDYVVCMSSAFSAGHGTQIAMERAGKSTRVVGVMGDSTFFHMGINGLIEVLYNKSKLIMVILDNRVTGMTGQQENPGSGKSAHGEAAPEMDIETICKALGAPNVVRVDPNNLKQVKETLDDAYSKDEPYVIITDWPCVLKPMDQKEYDKYGQDLFKKKYLVEEDKCIGCSACIKVGCPSISMFPKEGANKLNKLANIDDTCVGCTVCVQVCPTQAIQLNKDLADNLEVNRLKQTKPSFSRPIQF